MNEPSPISRLPRRSDARWFTSIQEIPLSRFIKALVDLDLQQLIIWGRPKDEDLLLAWSAIYEAFLDGMQGKKIDHRAKLIGEIERLDYDYRVVQMCVQRLSMGRVQWAVDQLKRRVRVMSEFNPEDMAQYYADLIIVMNHALAMKHRKSDKEAELEVIKSREPQSAGRPTVQQFDSLITRVSLFAKFQIDRKKTTVSEFVELYKEMKNHEDALKRQLETQNARR